MPDQSIHSAAGRRHLDDDSYNKVNQKVHSTVQLVPVIQCCGLQQQMCWSFVAAIDRLSDRRSLSATLLHGSLQAPCHKATACVVAVGMIESSMFVAGS